MNKYFCKSQFSQVNTTKLFQSRDERLKFSRAICSEVVELGLRSEAEIKSGVSSKSLPPQNQVRLFDRISDQLLCRDLTESAHKPKGREREGRKLLGVFLDLRVRLAAGEVARLSPCQILGETGEVNHFGQFSQPQGVNRIHEFIPDLGPEAYTYLGALHPWKNTRPPAVAGKSFAAAAPCSHEKVMKCHGGRVEQVAANNTLHLLRIGSHMDSLMSTGFARSRILWILGVLQNLCPSLPGKAISQTWCGQLVDLCRLQNGLDLNVCQVLIVSSICYFSVSTQASSSERTCVLHWQKFRALRLGSVVNS